MERGVITALTRCVTGLVALGAVVAVAGCTGSPPAADAVGSSSAASVVTTPSSPAPTPSESGCPAPPVSATPPVDFPHPALTPRPSATVTSAADDDLAAQGLAATRTLGGPVAASAFQHYLDATGGYLALPVDGLLTASPEFVVELDGVLVDVAAAAVQRVLATPAAGCATAGFTSGWRSHADVADSDWRFTLGRFSFQVLGTATRAANGVEVTYRVAIGDLYNFDPGSTFARFGRLATDGRAADYLDGGLTTVRSAVVTTPAGLGTPGFG